MLACEESILDALNEAGSTATREALQRFDTDGARLELGGQLWFSKGRQPKYYQTPYGEVEIERHVYQRSHGGKTFCPLERDGRIVVTSTPRFAKVISHKFSTGSSTAVRTDLMDNHARTVARSYLQRVAEAVGAVAQAKEESWSYATPRIHGEVASVAIGLDGTCMLLCEQGWREAMTGTISLYDGEGERLHTIYLGATPEYGKGRFVARLEAKLRLFVRSTPRPLTLGWPMGRSATGIFSVATPTNRYWISTTPRGMSVMPPKRLIRVMRANGLDGSVSAAMHSSTARERRVVSSNKCAPSTRVA